LTVIQARQLTSENKLIIRNAKLGKKSGGIMNLPLKLALYLLKDIHGDITLDIPLTGDLNDPKIRVGHLVWQTLKNVVVKIVASPFRALSGLVGIDPDEIKGIEFNYADTTLTDSHLRRIKLFLDLEKKKPDMKIDSLQNDYSQKRIKKIETALHAVNFSTRIKIFIPDKESPDNVGSRPVFKLKFSIDE
jgi:hypothetical protein